MNPTNILYRANKILWALFLIFFSIPVSKAQVSNSALVNRLCHEWKMVKTESDGKILSQPSGPIDFRLIIKTDSSLQQGLYPEGLIPSRWLLDENKMILTIIDDKTSMKYLMKIIRVSNTELILQDSNDGELVSIFYKRDAEE